MRQCLEKNRGRAAADVDACVQNKANVEMRPRKHQRHLDSDAGYVFDDLPQISTVRMPLRLEKGLQHVGAEVAVAAALVALRRVGRRGESYISMDL